MKHLARILAVVIPVVVVAYSTALQTPAITNLIAHHPGAAIYVVSVAGVLRAIYKAIKDGRAGATVPAPPSTGSSMGAK